jgi:replicative superfamily II helicase
MSGRAGRTGFDTRGDVVIVTANQQQLKHTRNVLLQPFTAKLSSALNGSRLVRSLLEIISACAVESLKELS